MTTSGAEIVRHRAVAHIDERPVTFSEYGLEDGYPVVALHGTPGSGLKFSGAAAEAARLGLRMICPDRWCYGGSKPPLGMSLSAYGHDIEQFADRLGVERFSVLGISGGGPFAVAVAATLSSRVDRLALISPVGPFAGAGGFSGLRPFHRFCFGLLPNVPALIRVVFGGFRLLLEVAPDAAMRIALSRAAKVDKRILLDGDATRRLRDAFRVGLASSTKGPAIDLRLFSQPWDVPFDRCIAPAGLWIGTEDRNVPVPAAVELARMIDARLIMLTGEGHYWFSGNFPTVLQWISESTTAARGARHGQP